MKLFPFRNFLPISIIFLATVLLVWLAGLTRDPLVIDIGGEDRLDQLYFQPRVDGFYLPESRPPGQGVTDTTYRWTEQYSGIYLSWPLQAVPLKTTLQATAPRPDRTPDKTGTILSIYSLKGSTRTYLGNFELNGLYAGTKIVLSMPEYTLPNLEGFRLVFEASETYRPGGSDTRNLSAIFLNLQIEPDYSRFGLKAWAASFARPLLLALMVLSIWGIAGLAGLSRNWRLALAGISAAILVASMLFWPLQAEPYYAAWALILLTGWFLFWLAGKLAGAAPGLPVTFVYVAVLLTGMPVAQFAFGRLVFNNLNYGLVALILFVAALVISSLAFLLAKPRFETVFMWVFLAASFLLFSYSQWRVFDENLYRGADFRNYYNALLDAQDGLRSLYQLEEMAASPGSAIRSAPAFAVLLWPFTILFGRDNLSALFWWRVTNLLLLLPTIWFILKTYPNLKNGVKLWPVVLLLVLNMGQIAETNGYGQQNIILLFGLATTGYFVSRKRDTLAGIVLAIPVLIKLLPGLGLIYFLIEKRWRGIIGFIGGALIISFLTLLGVGWNDLWFYFSKAMWGVNDPELGISNQSWWGFIGRLSVVEVKGDFAGYYPTQVSLVGYAGATVGVLVTLFWSWRRRGGDNLSDQLKLGALVLVGLWAAPFSWMHYIVPGLVAMVALTVYFIFSGFNKSQLLLFTIAYVLLAYGGRIEFFFTEAVGLARLGSSYRFIATFILWFLCLWALQKRLDETETTPSVVSSNEHTGSRSLAQ
jgi:alpha-1,2-mannosyltransferase